MRFVGTIICIVGAIETMHFTNKALKLTAKDVAEQFHVTGCIILTDDAEGAVRMAVVGLSSERARQVLCAAIADSYESIPAESLSEADTKQKAYAED
jgi:hypothetical protein